MAGGIITQADLSIINSTISGNSLEVEYGSFGAAGITAYGTLTLSLTYVTISNNLNTIDSNYPTGESISVDVISSTTVVDSVDSIFDASGGETVYLGPALLSIPWGTTCSRTPLALPSMPRIRPTPTRCLGHSPITAARPSRRLSCPAAPLAAGVPITGVTSDQRGVARPSSGPDIGAYEAVASDCRRRPAARRPLSTHELRRDLQPADESGSGPGSDQLHPGSRRS